MVMKLATLFMNNKKREVSNVVSANLKEYIKVLRDDHICIEDKVLENENLSDLKYKSLTVINSRFINCYFDGLNFKSCSFGAGFKQSVYQNCSFNHAKIFHTTPGNSRFENCSFQNVLIKDFFAINVEFVNCVFSGQIETAVFYGTVLEDKQDSIERKYNEFHNNDFSQILFHDVGFRTGIDLTKQKLPSGSQYLYLSDAFTAIEKTKVEINQWEDSEIKLQALKKIEILEYNLKRGQKQYFLQLDSILPDLDKELHIVYDILKRNA